MNLITPIILIIISIGTFFVYIDPNYRQENLASGKKSIIELQKEVEQYEKALNDIHEISAKRDSLIQQKAKISTEDLTKLGKLLPDNIDNIKLVIDIKNIAETNALTLKNIKLDTANRSESDKIGQDNNKYGTVGLSFSVNSTYENFQKFLTDLEKSLRLVEINELSVTGNETNIYDFSVSLKTYWLK
jgi:Tfp pilus assembly protein PilO